MPRRPWLVLVLVPLLSAFVAVSRAAGESAIHPENRPTGLDGETNGEVRPSALVKVEGTCRTARGAGPSLALMLAAARADGVGLLPDDCYRPADRQSTARSNSCSRGNCACAAKSGTSMHGWGKAVDFDDERGTLRFSGSPGYTWLKTNGARFGWNHAGWAEPGGSACPEAWHWEWVGDGGRMNLDPIRADVVALLPSGGQGYRTVTGLGAVASRGDATDHGSAAGSPLVALVKGAAPTPSGKGYWLVAADGGIFSFGDAGFFGSMGDRPLNRPITGMAATPSGRGYWLVAADGGLFSFGDARFFGSLGAIRLNQPIVAMAATPTGAGYWLVAADGGVFSFGDAGFFGSTGAAPPAEPVGAMAPSPSGRGYWITSGDGRVYAFGDATHQGDMTTTPPNLPVVGFAAAPGGRGYWLAGADGGIFAFGSARFHGPG